MIKIGITGGIGSGKSVVARLLELEGVPVYIADTESKRLTHISPVIREGLISLFGKEIYTPSGLNKKRLADRIFNEPENLKRVNDIIHPEVNKHFLEWVGKQKTNICALESAILFESGFDRIVDVRLMVYAPLSLRIERVRTRDKLSRQEVEERINNQFSDEIKKEKSDYIIYNDDKQALLPQVTRFLTNLQSN